MSVGQRGICSGVKAISEDGQIQGSSTQVALAQVQHRPVTIVEQCKGGKMVHEPCPLCPPALSCALLFSLIREVKCKPHLWNAPYSGANQTWNLSRPLRPVVV